MSAALIGFAVLFLGYSDSVRREWDFAVYYLAADALWSGKNPYDPHVLINIGKAVDGAGYEGLPYLYSPLFARLLYPFTRLSYFDAAFAWMALKCAALEWSLFSILMLLRLSPSWWSLALLNLGALFYRPIALDFNAGNVAVFESALILGSLAAWRRKSSAAAPLLLAAGAIKGTPLLMLLYPIHRRDYPFLKSFAAAFAVLLFLLLLGYQAVYQCYSFFHGPIWRTMWDEQVQSIYNCSSITVLLRTFSETYFSEPLYHSPFLTGLLIPLFPIMVFCLAAYGIYRRESHVEYENTDEKSLSIILLCLLLLPPRLAGYNLALSFYPLVQILFSAWREKRNAVLFIALIGLLFIQIDLRQIGIHKGHIKPGPIQLLIDKDFFGLLFLFIAAVTLCISKDFHRNSLDRSLEAK
ncbi:MAG: glycosyltransferase family 87 protein [Candidatus Omnitrophota bacterium]